MTELKPAKRVIFSYKIEKETWLNPYGDYDAMVLDATQYMNGIHKLWKLTSSKGATDRMLSDSEVRQALETVFLLASKRKDI